MRRIFILSMKSWSALIKRLDSVLLGVRIDIQNSSMWARSDTGVAAPPLDVKWTSKSSKTVSDRDGVLYLGGNMFCIQRGYFPEWTVKARIWKQFIDLVALKFKHGSDRVEKSFAPYAWDFIVVVLANAHSDVPLVVSACLVEYRNSLDISKAPYLYIGDLCTRDDHAHRKLATHVCCGVYQLAYLISTGVVTQCGLLVGNSENGLLGTDEKMYVALMIRQREHDVFENLKHLYSGCNFLINDLPESLNYGSCNFYSPYPFLDAERRLKTDGFECGAMYREVVKAVMFADNTVELLDPGVEGNEGEHFVFKYHSFPVAGIDFVKEHGLILDKHRVLFDDETNESYFSGDSPGILFENNFCDKANRAVFVIKARYFENDSFINCSLPSNLAVFIGSVPVYKARQLTSGVKQFSRKLTCLLSPKILG